MTKILFKVPYRNHDSRLLLYMFIIVNHNILSYNQLVYGLNTALVALVDEHQWLVLYCANSSIDNISVCYCNMVEIKTH